MPGALDVTSEVETLLSCYRKIPGKKSVNHHLVVVFIVLFFHHLCQPHHQDDDAHTVRGLLLNWWPHDDHDRLYHLVSGLCPPLLLVALLMLTPAQLPSQGGPRKLAVSCHQGQDEHVARDDLELKY